MKAFGFQNLAAIKKTDILGYMLLPQLKPRIKELFGRGLQFVPYFIALVYQCVRLLPPTHPYLNPSNIGRYGIRHVVAEAADNLELRTQNIDQIILFFMVLAGLVLGTLQLVLFGAALFIQPVMAAMPSSFSGFFLTPSDTQAHDLAHMILDLTFGVPGMFNSCIADAAIACRDMAGNTLAASDLVGGRSIFGDQTWPFPMHTALHQLFTVYSMGLLIVAIIIALYFMIAVVAETAQTGTPFGRRFSKVWAPLRIVLAFGLLVPVGYGMNAAQYTVLYAAKFGTGFATNGWILFNETLNAEYLGETKDLIAEPEIPEIGTLMQFFFVARTCFEAEQMIHGHEIKPYLVKDPFSPPQILTETFSYSQFIKFLNGDNLATIRFGIEDEEAYPMQKGNVSPICGQLHMQITDPRDPNAADKENQPEEGIAILQQFYFNFLRDSWHKHWVTGSGPNYPENYAHNSIQTDESGKEELPPEVRLEQIQVVEEKFRNELKKAITAQEASGKWEVNEDLRAKGWAGASVWYNRIAEMNGAVTSAVFKVPRPSHYPAIMEEVLARKQQYDQNFSPRQQFLPQLSGGQPVRLQEGQRGLEQARAYYSAHQVWLTDDGVASTHNSMTGNAFVDAVNLLLGTDGLFNMRENTDVHPLAQLSALGKGMVDSSINNLGFAAASSISTAMLGFIAPFAPALGQVAADFLISVAMIGLAIGFILFYVVPFLPFIYFFFAFGGWVKGIFEAMVGAPLWALAHIRIDGEGLPGQAGVSGYFLIFEIFLRPFLTVVGFLASVTIFSSMVEILNDIFGLVVTNVGGFDVEASEKAATPSELAYYRAPVDEFFFTILYAFVVYMMAMSSFKLIDQIPNNILRWMGQNITTFGDDRADPTEGVVQYVHLGSTQGLDQLGGGLSSLTGAAKNIGGGGR